MWRSALSTHKARVLRNKSTTFHKDTHSGTSEIAKIRCVIAQDPRARYSILFDGVGFVFNDRNSLITSMVRRFVGNVVLLALVSPKAGPLTPRMSTSVTYLIATVGKAMESEES